MVQSAYRMKGKSSAHVIRMVMEMVAVKPIRPTVVTDSKIIKAILKEVATAPTEEAIKKNVELSKLLKKVRA